MPVNGQFPGHAPVSRVRADGVRLGNVTAVEFQLLGNISAHEGGTSVDLGRRHERLVLGLLLTERGRAVGAERLADLVWDGVPPAGARRTIQTYVARLRKALAPSGAEIVLCGGGYRIEASDCEVDLYRFLAHLDAAAAEREPERQAHLLRTALELWEGPLFGSVGSDLARERVGAAFDEARLDAFARCAEADLAAGHPERALALLAPVALGPPVRERLIGLLMSAYHAAGRTTEALAIYQVARRGLVDQFGVEPGPELQRRYVDLLRATSVTIGAEAVVPREMPPVPGAFTGRRAELGRIVAALREPVPAGRATVVVVHGRGGTGKSALAVRSAHEVAEDFPDGQVYVDMCGATPGLRGRTAREAITQALRSLGVRPEDVPEDEAEAAGRLRSVTGYRRILFVLDNAPDVASVRPLVPARRGCAVLVTSRDPLASLDAELSLCLSGLTDADAHTLLERAARRAGEPAGGYARIVRACEHLPLALRIAAARLRSRPDLTVEALALRLADQRRRLDELDVDGLAVRGSIQVTYDALRAGTDPLDTLAAAAFVRLPLLPLPSTGPEWVAALVGSPDVSRVRAALDRLCTLHLLHPDPGGRYGMHDLVRLFAAERAETEVTVAERYAAVDRALAFYLITSVRVCEVLVPSRLPEFPEAAPRTGLPDAGIATPSDATAWLDAELPNVRVAAEATVTTATEHALYAFCLARALLWSLGKRGDWATEHDLARYAVASARLGDDPIRLGEALKMAGWSEVDMRRPDRAMVYLEEALLVARRAGATRQMLATLNDMSRAALIGGDDDLSMARLCEAQRVAEREGCSDYEAVTQLNMSSVWATRRDWPRALAALDASRDIRLVRGDRAGLAIVLPARGSVLFHLERHGEAFTAFDSGVRACRAVGNEVDEWYSLVGRSLTHLAAARVRPALRDAVTATRMCGPERPYETAVAARLMTIVIRYAGHPAWSRDWAERADRAYACYEGYREPAYEAMLARLEAGVG